MAFDTIDRQNMIIIFAEAALDPVGHEDRTKDPTSENYDENLLSETSTETFFSEDCDEEEHNRPWVADTRLCMTQVAELILATINDRQVIDAKYCGVIVKK